MTKEIIHHLCHLPPPTLYIDRNPLPVSSYRRRPCPGPAGKTEGGVQWGHDVLHGVGAQAEAEEQEDHGGLGRGEGGGGGQGVGEQLRGSKTGFGTNENADFIPGGSRLSGTNKTCAHLLV